MIGLQRDGPGENRLQSFIYKIIQGGGGGEGGGGGGGRTPKLGIGI